MTTQTRPVPALDIPAIMENDLQKTAPYRVFHLFYRQYVGHVVLSEHDGVLRASLHAGVLHMNGHTEVVDAVLTSDYTADDPGEKALMVEVMSFAAASIDKQWHEETNPFVLASYTMWANQLRTQITKQPSPSPPRAN